MNHVIDLPPRARPAQGTPTLRLVASPARDLEDARVAQVLRLIAGSNPPGGPRPLRIDFNSQLLSLALEPASRASLRWTLERLVAAGLLACRSANEYSLTEAGVLSMQRAQALEA